MGQIVIACYRPRPGQEAALEDEVRRHHANLRALELVTDRVPIIGRAKDGTFVEVFEWNSAEAIERAHEHPEVLAMWARYEPLCEYVKLADLAESAELFAGFTPV